MIGARPAAELGPVKEALWRAAEWSAVMAALCYLFLWTWAGAALDRRRLAERRL